MIIFSVEGRNVLSARVYKDDGIEIDYYQRSWKSPKLVASQSFWHFEWSGNTGMFNERYNTLLLIQHGITDTTILLFFIAEKHLNINESADVKDENVFHLLIKFF